MYNHTVADQNDWNHCNSSISWEQKVWKMVEKSIPETLGMKKMKNRSKNGLDTSSSWQNLFPAISDTFEKKEVLKWSTMKMWRLWGAPTIAWTKIEMKTEAAAPRKHVCEPIRSMMKWTKTAAKTWASNHNIRIVTSQRAMAASSYVWMLSVLRASSRNLKKSFFGILRQISKTYTRLVLSSLYPKNQNPLRKFESSWICIPIICHVVGGCLFAKIWCKRAPVRILLVDFTRTSNLIENLVYLLGSWLFFDLINKF